MATIHHQIAYRLQDHAFDLLIPGHTGDTIFIKANEKNKLPDGSIRTTYEPITAPEHTYSASGAPSIFQVLMIHPVTSEDDIPIHKFKANGSPIYTDKISDHFIWDVDLDRPFVQSTESLPDGSLKQPSQDEQVLNWHSQNVRVQNRVLHSIDWKIDQVTQHVSQHDLHRQHLDSSLRNMYTDLQFKVARLDIDLHHYINQGYFSPEFDNKEREIRQLKE
ncbi:hypothetical protein Ddye_012590 [Dipteronia dyeriana]|uniref:Uncharacterized protein n=1 Tax=Dipteronia dyeriana TaxID=168575 RepID=A0AAE0CIU5_9ROSI|nr:hypothetical protein Ddye_012590 [Dipteronia dyeriana]